MEEIKMKIDKKWKPTLAYYTDEELIDLLDKENTIEQQSKGNNYGNEHTTDDTIRTRNATPSERNQQ